MNESVLNNCNPILKWVTNEYYFTSRFSFFDKELGNLENEFISLSKRYDA
jgi:hypothetical protein